MAANVYDSGKHDIGVDYSGTVYGMMLAQKDGVPQWAEYDDEYLATQFFTGEPSASNLPPEREISFVRADHRSSFGEDVYDPNDPKRYKKSIGADLRFKDRAMLSWGATAVSYYAATWTSPTGFVDGDAAWQNETNAYDDNTGTFTLGEVSIPTESWIGYLELTHSAITTDTVRLWVDRENAAVNLMDVDFYYDSAWHNVYEDDFSTGKWMIIVNSAGRKAVTSIRVRFYNSDAGVAYWCKVYEADYMTQGAGSGKAPVTFTEFNSKLYLAMSDTLYVMGGDGTYF